MSEINSPLPLPERGHQMTETHRAFSDVRQWVWDRNKPSQRAGIAVFGHGKSGLRLFLNSRIEAEELVEQIIELMEQDIWEINK